jgi:hypothetical protein
MTFSATWQRMQAVFQRLKLDTSTNSIKTTSCELLNIVIWYSPKAKATTNANAKTEAGPSLRLKNAYGQDDRRWWGVGGSDVPGRVTAIANAKPTTNAKAKTKVQMQKQKQVLPSA